LLDGRVDIAVHSLKDMPTELPAGLQITATPEREDPRDAMVGSTLAGLPPGARVGTGSLRRIAQLHASRSDVIVEPVRGNVDTRLRKLDEGQFQAIVLAAAGLRRLGWAERIAEYLSPDVMCPAVGQGALAIETRADGGTAQHVVMQLDHQQTHAAITAERAVLSVLGGGCQVPVGAYASPKGAGLHVVAVVSSPDGKTLVRRQAEGESASAERIGEALGRDLLEAGAAEILSAVYG
jgi:hydroxymethylbilane synthase